MSFNIIDKFDTYSKNKNLTGYKCTIIGSSGCGKSSILTRAVRNTFSLYNDATIGAAFYILNKQISENPPINIKLEICDTAGQERFASLVTMYLRGSHVILIVYDLNSESSFKDITIKWLPYLNKEANYKPEALWYIIANKYDLNPNQELIIAGQNLAKELNAKFFVTSAKDSIGINELFMDISNTLNNKNFKQTFEIPKPITLQTNKDNRNCWKKFLSYFYI